MKRILTYGCVTVLIGYSILAILQFGGRPAASTTIAPSAPSDDVGGAAGIDIRPAAAKIGGPSDAIREAEAVRHRLLNERLSQRPKPTPPAPVLVVPLPVPVSVPMPTPMPASTPPTPPTPSAPMPMPIPAGPYNPGAFIGTDAQLLASLPPVSSDPTATHNQRFVAFGGTADPQYLFYAPIAAFLWARLGWIPIFMYITTTPANVIENDDTYQLVKHYIETNCGGRVLILSADDYDTNSGSAVRIAQRRAAADHKWLIAQMSRIFAACDSQLPLDAILMTSDADMLVLKNDLWDVPTRQQNSPEENAKILLQNSLRPYIPAHYYGYRGPGISDRDPWNANDALGFQMCFIYARVWVWRQVLEFNADEYHNGCNPGTKIIDLLAAPTTKVEWGFDQIYITSQFKKWRARNPNGKIDASTISGPHSRATDPRATATRMDLHFRNYEIDKEMDGRFRPWKYEPGFDLSVFTTAHAPRPDGYKPEKWEITRRALATALPDEILTNVVDVYYQQWMGARSRKEFPPTALQRIQPA